MMRSEMARRWMTLVGLVMLIGVTGLAFVNYEMIRADADAAHDDAMIARAHCFSSSPASISERKRRNARCESRLPTPQRAADRIERRWDRRGPWYGLVAGAILIPTAFMFVRSRRRTATSATVDSSASRFWRVTTIAVEFAVGILIWLALYHLAVDRWAEFVEATGGTTLDCGGNCGVLGEFTEAHPRILFWLFRVGAAIPAAASIWLLSRFFRSLDQPERHTAPAVRAQ